MWNKVDQVPKLLEKALLKQRGGVAVSALERRGFDELLINAEDTLFSEGADADAAVLAQVTAGVSPLSDPLPRGEREPLQ